MFSKISIIDNGIGINDYEINHIFKRFYRSIDVSETEGVGVGLYLAREIINKQSGYLLGIVFIPMVGNMLEGLNRSSFESFNIIIFVLAAIFSYMTVRISCKKPAKIASNVSPIDAVRYSDGDNSIKKKSKKGKNGSKIHKMALSNMFRNKKKAFLVLISMSLSCFIFLAVSTIISSSDPNKAGDGVLLGDLEIKHGAIWNINNEEDPSIPIDENIINDINNIDGVKNVYKMYSGVDRVAYKGDLKEEVLTQEVEQEYMDWIYDGKYPKDVAESYGAIMTDLYGLSSGILMERMIESNNTGFSGDVEIISGKLDIEKFNKSGYVILRGHENSKVKVGDKISFKYLKSNLVEEGYSEIELEVMVILGGAKNYQMSLYVNEDDFKSIEDTPYIEDIIIDTKDKNTDKVEDEIIKLNEKYNNPYTQVYSKRFYIEEAKEYQMTITIIGMSAVFIIGLIGVLNFVNTMITNIISRKKEFAMLEAVGMTKKQLKKILILEGLYYGAIITIGNLTIGTLGTVLGFNVMKLRYSVYTYPISAFAMCTILLFIICIIVRLIVYNILSKDSIVDRIRTNE